MLLLIKGLKWVGILRKMGQRNGFARAPQFREMGTGTPHAQHAHSTHTAHTPHTAQAHSPSIQHTYSTHTAHSTQHSTQHSPQQHLP